MTGPDSEMRKFRETHVVRFASPVRCGVAKAAAPGSFQRHAGGNAGGDTVLIEQTLSRLCALVQCELLELIVSWSAPCKSAFVEKKFDSSRLSSDRSSRYNDSQLMFDLARFVIDPLL